jgi:hypothetical protein
MKIETHSLPSEEKANIVLIRFVPEKASERKQIAKAREALRGTNALAASPEIDKETVLSLMFNLYAKKNQEKKA